jgi:hypothetical protein
MSKPCTVTCFIALVIVVAMIIMSMMVYNDPFIKSYSDNFPDDIKQEYNRIVSERHTIFYTGYLIGVVLSIFAIIFGINILKRKMSISMMICFTIVLSSVVNYLYYVMAPKSNYMVNILKTDEQRSDWLKVYKSMQFYFHGSFVLGAIAVGVFTYAFRGNCF